MSTKTQATIEDLYRVPENGKAEIVNGDLVLMSPTGGRSSRVGGKIYISLDAYVEKTGKGLAYPDNAAFIVNLPNRQSFSPDAAYYIGEEKGLKFLEGAPVFAVEVRSEGDYGDWAEQRIAAKRHDYFAAGTLVVWDVDILNKLVRVYRASDSDHPVIYLSGAIAEAEPAVPGWTLRLTML